MASADAASKKLDDKALWEGLDRELPDEVRLGTLEDISKRTRLLV